MVRVTLAAQVEADTLVTSSDASIPPETMPCSVHTRL
jgi:hypothetical protein